MADRLVDILVRGVPDNLHREIREFATRENLSVNQVLLRLLQKAVERSEKENEEQKRRDKAFKRLNKRREEIRRKYGLQEDSTRIIREDRDSH